MQPLTLWEEVEKEVYSCGRTGRRREAVVRLVECPDLTKAKGFVGIED